MINDVMTYDAELFGLVVIPSAFYGVVCFDTYPSLSCAFLYTS
jgi:hypothetical protein